MSGRRRNHLKRSSENIARKKVLRPELLDLPTELLELMLSRLSSRDKARASAVCRKWREIAKSLEKINRPLVLMFVPVCFDGIYYCNPADRHKNFRLPKRPGSLVCHAEDDWMLSFVSYTEEMILFCLHTQELFKLPKLQFRFCGAAFSAPPTSPSCIVFTMYCDPLTNTVKILTCHPRDAVWTTANYQSKLPFIGCLWNCVVVRNGIFYCLDSTGHIGMYDPIRTTWRVLPVEPLKCMKYLNMDACEKHLFMAEYNGDIFLLRIWRVVRPVVYKVDEINNIWVKVKHLGGATFFASSKHSLIRDDLPKSMKDCIYFPKFVDDEKSCVTYSLKHKRYCTEFQSYFPGALDRRDYAWIDLKDPTS